MIEPVEEDVREFPIVNGQYDDDDASHLPLLDEGWWGEEDWDNEPE